MKTLLSLLCGIEYKTNYDTAVYPAGINGICVGSVCYNSKNAEAGSLFVCIKGARSDGHDYAVGAYEKGARIFICEREISPGPEAVVIIVNNSRLALSKISSEFFGHPENKLKIIGITGTKGKSTVAYMTAHILQAFGASAGIIGTCGVVINGKTEPTDNTTPESFELFRAFDKMVKAGCEYAVVEVSSQSVLLGRINGIRFFSAVMTNLSPDHIGPGEHSDFNNYKECKKALFARCDHAVFNADDKYFNEFVSGTDCGYSTYSVRAAADFSAENISYGKDFLSTEFDLFYNNKLVKVNIPMPGIFSVSNALAALAVCSHAGINPEKAARTLAVFSVPGRFEPVFTAIEGVRFIIDYAHNGESLLSALNVLREYMPKRLICLFGSVGCRTQLRRADLGKAAQAADFCILTSDNPDSEAPDKIISDIADNLGNTPFIAIPDREEAIEYAVKNAQTGDIILLAGKGHENYQLINGIKIPFNEKELILKYSAKLSGIKL